MGWEEGHSVMNTVGSGVQSITGPAITVGAPPQLTDAVNSLNCYGDDVSQRMAAHLLTAPPPAPTAYRPASKPPVRPRPTTSYPHGVIMACHATASRRDILS